MRSLVKDGDGVGGLTLFFFDNASNCFPRLSAHRNKFVRTKMRPKGGCLKKLF